MQGLEMYEATANEASLDHFISEHKILVKKIALHIKKRLPSHIELDDLLQSGFVGLLEARRNYKPDLGTSFETFASIRIRGSIIDSLRKNSWGTRETIHNMRLIGDAIAKIEQRNHKQPTTEEIIAELGISIDEHMAICQQISLSNVVSFDAGVDDSVFPGDEDDDPELITQEADMINHIKKYLTDLPEREQQVLSLYYVEEFTFKQIGEILSLTEARICQLHSQAIARLQTKLQKSKAK